MRQLAAPAHLTVDADIPIKILKGDLSQRRLLLSALPRFTLMLYELSNRDERESPEKKTDKLRAAIGEGCQSSLNPACSARRLWHRRPLSLMDFPATILDWLKA